MIEVDHRVRDAEDAPAPWVIDALLGIGVALVVALFIAADITQERPDPWAYLWAAALGGLMLLRRRYPVIVVGLTVVLVISYYAVGFPPIGVAVPLAAAVFSAAEYGRTGAAIGASVILLSVSVGYRLITGQDPSYVGYEIPGHALLLAGAIAVGDNVRSRRELRRQAMQIAELSKERYARLAEQRVLAERLAVARELHDSVGHALTVVTLHTQVMEEALGTDDAQLRRSLSAISATTAETFDDLRRTVAGLRSDRPHRSPLRLSGLTAATTPAAQAGITVDTRIDLTSPLSPAIEAAVFRIVQESTTNIVRHAQATHADIVVEERDSAVHVSIVNDDTYLHPVRNVADAEGNGIIGMRERAQSLGGTFTAGPHRGGFAVRASIPLTVVE